MHDLPMRLVINCEDIWIGSKCRVLSYLIYIAPNCAVAVFEITMVHQTSSCAACRHKSVASTILPV